MLYIPQINQLELPEFKKLGIPVHLVNCIKIAHWVINDADSEIYIPAYQGYTFTNVSEWEIERIITWMTEKSKTYKKLYRSGKDGIVSNK